jgi:hypothetical protein
MDREVNPGIIIALPPLTNSGVLVMHGITPGTRRDITVLCRLTTSESMTLNQKINYDLNKTRFNII